MKVCAVYGDWALVQTTGSKGIYGFVKVAKLTDIRTEVTEGSFMKGEPSERDGSLFVRFMLWEYC